MRIVDAEQAKAEVRTVLLAASSVCNVAEGRLSLSRAHGQRSNDADHYAVPAHEADALAAAIGGLSDDVLAWVGVERTRHTAVLPLPA